MLKPLKLSKVTAALADLPIDNPPTADDIQQLFVTPAYIEVVYTDGTETVLFEVINLDDQGTLAKFSKALYGGDPKDVSAIEVFPHGYAVETRTDVFHNNSRMYEYRVGHVIK